MSTDDDAKNNDDAKKIKIGDIYISHALHEEIKNSTPYDMPMTYLSAIAALGSQDAQCLMRHLGASDPTWFEAVPDLKPEPTA